MQSTIDLETKVGTLKNFPTALLGWITIAGIAAFLIFQLTGNYSKQLDKQIELVQRQLTVLDHIDRKLDTLIELHRK